MRPEVGDRQWRMDSVIGTLYLVASADALHVVGWREESVEYAQTLAESEILRRAVGQLDEYFAGARREFALPLAARGGTEFQRTVWRALGKIPFGVTRSYGELARTIARDRAVRAVGAANGQNPLAVVVPCHRVIGADGGLGGFAGGLEAKARLLAIEGFDQWERRGLCRRTPAR